MTGTASRNRLMKSPLAILVQGQKARADEVGRRGRDWPMRKKSRRRQYKDTTAAPRGPGPADFSPWVPGPDGSSRFYAGIGGLDGAPCRIVSKPGSPGLIESLPCGR